MKETALYAKIRPHLMSWGECDRIENTLGSGVADVFYNIGGVTGWLETKVVKGGLIYFEKFQPNWLSKHVRAGHTRLFVVVMDERDAIHFFPAGVVLKAPRTAVKDWITVRMQDLPPVFNMPPPYRSWRSVKEVLTS